MCIPHVYGMCIACAQVCFHFALSLIFLVTFIPFPMEGPGEPYLAPIWDEENFNGNSLWRSHEHAAITALGVGAAFIGFCLLGAVVNALDEGELTTAEAIGVFCAKYRVPYATHRELQRYFKSLAGLQGTVPKGELFEQLSPPLAQDMMLQIHHAWICRLPFYEALAGEYGAAGVPRSGRVIEKATRFFAQLAMRMQPALFVSGERPPPRRLCVLVAGVAVNTRCTHAPVHPLMCMACAWHVHTGTCSSRAWPSTRSRGRWRAPATTGARCSR